MPELIAGKVSLSMCIRDKCKIIASEQIINYAGKLEEVKRIYVYQ